MLFFAQVLIQPYDTHGKSNTLLPNNIVSIHNKRSLSFGASPQAAPINSEFRIPNSEFTWCHFPNEE